MNGMREQCLDQLRKAIPEAMELMESPAGDLSLANYARAMPGGGPALQDADDLIALAQTEAGRLFSPATGAALRRELENRFLALTANHHGVDFHPEFLQGDLIFALGCQEVVPLFACGGVPCNNMAYPRGLLLPPPHSGTTKPGRFPALAAGDRHALVSAQIPFRASHIRSALDSLPHSDLHEEERAFATVILKEIYLHPSVLSQETFRDQMSAANALLWSRLATPDSHLPPLVSLDLQYLCGVLAADDLDRPGSLVHDLLLEPALTEEIFRTLNGARSCWTLNEGQAGRGTFLLWALDEKKRGVALRPDFAKRELLAPSRPDIRFKLDRDSLKEGLVSLRLLPGLYLAFAVSALARGLVCAGGVFQYAYLPNMARGTAEALRRCGEEAAAGKISARCPLGTGFHPLQAPDIASSEGEHSAGPLDILRHGGLDARDRAALSNIKTREAFLCSLPFQYEDLIPEGERISGWFAALRHTSPLLLSPKRI